MLGTRTPKELLPCKRFASFFHQTQVICQNFLPLSAKCFECHTRCAALLRSLQHANHSSDTTLDRLRHVLEQLPHVYRLLRRCLLTRLSFNRSYRRARFLNPHHRPQHRPDASLTPTVPATLRPLGEYTHLRFRASHRAHAACVDPLRLDPSSTVAR